MRPIARLGDRVVGLDLHLAPGTPPRPAPMAFCGALRGGLATGVRIQGLPAATVGSVAWNELPHVCVDPASNTGVVAEGSPGVRIQGRPAARHGDRALTCQLTGPAPQGTVVAGAPVAAA